MADLTANSDYIRQLFGLPPRSTSAADDTSGTLTPGPMTASDIMSSAFGFRTPPAAPAVPASEGEGMEDYPSPKSRRDLLGEAKDFFSQGTGRGPLNYNLDLGGGSTSTDDSGRPAVKDIFDPSLQPGDTSLISGNVPLSMRLGSPQGLSLGGGGGGDTSSPDNLTAQDIYGSGSGPPAPGQRAQGTGALDWLSSLVSGGSSLFAPSADGSPTPPIYPKDPMAVPAAAFNPYGSTNPNAAADAAAFPPARPAAPAAPPLATPAAIQTGAAAPPPGTPAAADAGQTGIFGIPRKYLPISDMLGMFGGGPIPAAQAAPVAPAAPAGPNLVSPMAPNAPPAAAASAPPGAGGLVAGPAGTPGPTFGQHSQPVAQLASQIAQAASAAGKPLVSPDIQAALRENAKPSSTPASVAAAMTNNGRVATGIPPRPAVPATGGGGGGGAGGGGGGAVAPGSPGSNPGDAKVAQPPTGVPASTTPLPAGVPGVLARFGFKLPAQTWDALIAFGAGLMKNSDKPHFAQAAGAALESATALMTDQDKTKFTQDLENRKLIAQNEQRRAELQARIDNQKLTAQERQLALEQRAELAREHNELIGTIAQGRRDDAQAQRDQALQIAQGNQNIAQGNLDQRTAAAAAAERDRVANLQREQEATAQTVSKDAEARVAMIPGLSDFPNLQSAWVAGQVAGRAPNSTFGQSYATTYKPQIIAVMRDHIAHGFSPQQVLRKFQMMDFPGLSMSDLQ